LTNSMFLVRKIIQPDEEGHYYSSASNVYIFPSKFGATFLFSIAVLLVGSINYANNLGFLLTFFLLSVFMVTLFETWSLLTDIKLYAYPITPVYAGDSATLGYRIESTRDRFIGNLTLTDDRKTTSTISYVPGKANNIQIARRMKRRGIYPTGIYRMECVYPLGLFRSWFYFQSVGSICVYPSPATSDIPHSSLLGVIEKESAEAVFSTTDTNNIIEFKRYQAGDSPRSIYWKSFARGLPLMRIVYGNVAQDNVVLDINKMPALDIEGKLSNMVYCCLYLSQRNINFGIKLDQMNIKPGIGEVHLAHVLEYLAGYNQ
jgi:uncharacterized protein (DUF58 family)